MHTINGNIQFFDTLHATFNEPDDYEFYCYSDSTGTEKYYVKKVTYLNNLGIVQGKVGIMCKRYYLNEPWYSSIIQHIEYFFLPIRDVPDNLKIWCIPNRIGSHYSSGRQGLILDCVDNSYALFHESSTNLTFALSCPDVPNINNSIFNNSIASFACEIPYSNLGDNKKKFLHSIHIAGVMKNQNYIYIDDDGIVGDYEWTHENDFYVESIYDLYVFRSTLHNYIFDFDSELKRSALS